MKTQKELENDCNILLKVVKAAYRKHHFGDDFVGWEELDEMMLDALCNVMGNDGYYKWLASAFEED